MVRYAKEHKEESRTRIVDAAGRGFRRQGFGGVGVDGLAREAGVTHGAFYGHFRSKTEAFRAAVVAGLGELRGGVETLRARTGDNWVKAFAEFYMGPKRTCEPGVACTVPSLSPDVERADAETREAYQQEMKGVIAAIAAGLPGSPIEAEERAWVLMSLLAGGVTLARAVPDQALSERIAAAISKAANVLSCELPPKD